MTRFSQMNDAELSAWVTNFTTIVGVSPTGYGLATGQATDFQTANTNLQTKMTACAAAADAAKTAAGIDPKKTPTRTPPVTLEQLTVMGYDNNRNVLKWKKAGKKQNTQFIIEYCQAGDTEFEDSVRH